MSEIDEYAEVAEQMAADAEAKQAPELLMRSAADWATLREFKLAARALKASEQAYKAAQVTYADAVRRMSDLAVAETDAP